MPPGECWNCGQWLTSTEKMEGYCWRCNATVPYPDDREIVAETKREEAE